MIRHRYRVAPEPPPQLSLREEVALFKAKMREIKAARIAAVASVHKAHPIIKPKKRSMRNEHSKKCFQAIGIHCKAIYNDMFSNFKRKLYLCLGFACCMASEMRVFVDEEFPSTRGVPVV